MRRDPSLSTRLPGATGNDRSINHAAAQEPTLHLLDPGPVALETDNTNNNQTQQERNCQACTILRTGRSRVGSSRTRDELRVKEFRQCDAPRRGTQRIIPQQIHDFLEGVFLSSPQQVQCRNQCFLPAHGNKLLQ